MDGITRCPPVSEGKQDAGVSSAEELRKLLGWHARQEAYPYTVPWQEMWPRGLRGQLRNYI